MVCALKIIAVEVHNVAMHDSDLMRISSLSGLDYTTFYRWELEELAVLNWSTAISNLLEQYFKCALNVNRHTSPQCQPLR